MIELTPLRYFLSAYESGSFSHAARMNQVSQPTVSTAIQKLEDELGGVLFHRSRRGLRATALGQRVYAEAGESVKRLSGMAERLKPASRSPLRIYCHPDVVLTPFISSFRKLQNMQPDVVPSFTEQVEKADIALVSEPCTPVGHDFFLLSEEAYGVALATDHLLAEDETIDLKQLEQEPRIHRPYCPNADRMVGESLPNLELPAQAVNDQQVLDLVAAGLGIAFVPLSHGEGHTGVVVRPLRNVPTQVTRRIGVSARKSVFAHEIASLLRDFY